MKELSRLTMMNNSSKENRSEWLKYRDGVGVCAGGPELDLDKLNLT